MQPQILRFVVLTRDEGQDDRRILHRCSKQMRIEGQPQILLVALPRDEGQRDKVWNSRRAAAEMRGTVN